MKITIIGSGNVGSTCASIIAQKDLAREIVLLDNRKNISEGKSLDITQMVSVFNCNTKVIGFTNDYLKSKNSDIIVITCGIARKPGMSRDNLLIENAKIIRSVTENTVNLSPNAIFIIVSNPLDIMSYVSFSTSKIKPSHVIGMAGILDISRYRFFLSKKLGISHVNIQSILLGGHGDTMVPLYRYTSISGIPIKEFISEKENDSIIENTKKGGEEIVNYLGTSAWMAPAASIVEMIESISKNSKKIFPCSVFLNGEYNLRNLFIGVPVILGSNGIYKIIELKLNKKEKKLFRESANHIKKMIEELKNEGFSFTFV